MHYKRAGFLCCSRMAARHSIVAAIIPALALLLQGCGPDTSAHEALHKALYPQKIGQITGKGIPPATAPPPPAPSPLDDIATSVAPPPPTTFPGSTSNAYLPSYVTYAGIYWKLNWMRKELLGGRTPANMLDVLREEKRRLSHVEVKDGNYVLADEALARFMAGLQHLACYEKLQSAGIDVARAPWTGTVLGMQRYLKGGADTLAVSPPPDLLQSDMDMPATSQPPAASSGAGGGQPEPAGASTAEVLTGTRSTGPAPATLHPNAASLALSYATRYQASPLTMMRREWEQAIRETNRLRDQLHLQGRPENNDGDRTDVSAAVSEAAFMASTIPTPPVPMSGAAPDEVFGP